MPNDSVISRLKIPSISCSNRLKTLCVLSVCAIGSFGEFDSDRLVNLIVLDCQQVGFRLFVTIVLLRR